ncbi:MAG: DUF72 domain-containing protein [Promethearchaeota archaeon]
MGTSGWAYSEWKGPFYPANISQSQMLDYYIRFFKTSEINSSFYRIPSRKNVEIWDRKTPNNFKFSAKIPKSITHDAKLDMADKKKEAKIKEDLNIFLDSMIPLIKNNKLLSLLLQLPPSFAGDYAYKNLELFLKYWTQEVIPYLIEELESLNRKIDLNLVVEFRNKFWLPQNYMDNKGSDIPAFNLLRQWNIGYCSVVEPLLPPVIEMTNKDILYVRFHGFGKKPWFDYCFSESELEIWANKLKGYIDGGITNVATVKNKDSDKNLNKGIENLNKIKPKYVMLYFNNHYSGFAIENAAVLGSKLNILNKQKAEIILSNFKKYNLNRKKNNKKALKQLSLDKFSTKK